MKRLSILLLLAALVANGQSPESFKYQAVIRGSNGMLLLGKAISVRVSILESTASGTTVYSEQHSVTTSTLGIVNLEIGKGTTLIGTFTDIGWGNDEHFIKVEMDPNGGSTFELIGVSQLLSVPYALFANRSAGPWVSNQVDNGLSYMQGKVSIGTTSQVSPSSLFINTPLPTSFETRSNGIFLEANDMISRGYPFWIRSNTSSMSYGTNLGQTLGRMFRMQDLRFGFDAIWDFGIDENKSLYIMGGNNDYTKKFSITTTGAVGINKANPGYTLDVGGAINATGYLVNGVPFTANNTWALSNNDISYTVGKVSIGTTSQVSPSALFINVPLPTSFETRSNGIFLEANDMISRGYPLWIRSNTSSMNYGTSLGETQGRMFRMQDLRFGFDAIWDFGIDENKSLYIMGGNSDFTKKFSVTTSGNVGINNATPASKLDVKGGDIYLSTIGNGVIMKSPDGGCWRLTVDNAGAPVFTSITCPN